MPDPALNPPDRSAGYALVVVIWFLALITVLQTGLSLVVRAATQAAVVNRGHAQAVALADGAVALAIRDLIVNVADPARRRFPVGGDGTVCDFNNSGAVRVQVVDEGGKIDLNLADENLIKALLLGMGLPTDQATRLTAAIQDFKDSDDDRRPGGAEIDDYAPQGRYGPKNAPFDSPDEIAQVLGVTEEIATALRPHLTVHSQQPGVDPKVVTPELAAILNRGASLLGSDARGGGLGGAGGQVSTQFVATSAGRSFTIFAAAQIGPIQFVREVLVLLTRSTVRPYRIVNWRQPVAPLKKFSPGSYSSC